MEIKHIHEASCGVRINYDKVIKEVSGGFVTIKSASGLSAAQQEKTSLRLAPFQNTL